MSTTSSLACRDRLQYPLVRHVLHPRLPGREPVELPAQPQWTFRAPSTSSAAEYLPFLTVGLLAQIADLAHPDPADAPAFAAGLFPGDLRRLDRLPDPAVLGPADHHRDGRPFSFLLNKAVPLGGSRAKHTEAGTASAALDPEHAGVPSPGRADRRRRKVSEKLRSWGGGGRRSTKARDVCRRCAAGGSGAPSPPRPGQYSRTSWILRERPACS